MNTIKKKSSWEKIRSTFQTIHLWIGLISGIFVFVICLTGTIYTFADDIKKMMNPELYKVHVQDTKMNIATLEKIIKEDIKTDITGLVIPDASDEPYTFLYQKEGEKRPSQIRINPYSGEIMKSKGKEKGAEFFSTVFRLHRWFLMDTETGRPIVGVVTLLFAIGCLTGIVIWFPRKIKYWRQGLKIKTGNWKRLNFDLHSTLGFYSFIFNLIMALTGLTWSFEWYKKGYNSVLGASHLNKKSEKPNDKKKEPTHNSSPLNDTVEIDWDTLYAHAQKYFNYEGNIKMSLPKTSKTPVTITKAGTSFWAYSNSDEVKLDSYTYELKEQKIFTDQPIGHQIALSYKALHVGNIFGTGTKIIYFLSCLIATSLPITGVIMYINRIKKKGKKKTKN